MDHDYCAGGENKNNDTCKQCKIRDTKIQGLDELVAKRRKDSSTWKTKFMQKEKRAFGYKNINTDEKVRTFTGIPNLNTFNVLFESLEPRIPKIKYWRCPSRLSSGIKRKFTRSPKKCGPARRLSPKDEFLLTLMKLRLGSINANLAERFDISATTLSNIVNT